MSQVYVLYDSLTTNPSDVTVALTWEGVMREARQALAEVTGNRRDYMLNEEPVCEGKVNAVITYQGEPWLMVYCAIPEEVQMRRLVDALKGL